VVSAGAASLVAAWSAFRWLQRLDQAMINEQLKVNIGSDAGDLSRRQLLASNEPVHDDYDPCKPEYIILATEEEKLSIRADQQSRQIAQLQSCVDRLQSETAESTIISHYKSVVDELRDERVHSRSSPLEPMQFVIFVNFYEGMAHEQNESAALCADADLASTPRRKRSSSSLSTSFCSESMRSSSSSASFSEQRLQLELEEGPHSVHALDSTRHILLPLEFACSVSPWCSLRQCDFLSQNSLARGPFGCRVQLPFSIESVRLVGMSNKS
jgi:hypothetical protein